MQPITFTEDQIRAYTIIASGQNTFLTGCPGTGKSFLLRMIRERHGYDGSTVFVAPNWHRRPES